MNGTTPSRILRFFLLLALCTLFFHAAALAVPPSSAETTSPVALTKRRVRLYFEGARESLSKIAPQVYALAAASERCRISDGSKACGLPETPQNSTGLKEVFDYYVKGPVDAFLARQRVGASKSDWTWQTYSTQESGSPR